MNVDDLKLLIASKLDVLEFLDIIGYDIGDLVNVLGDEIEEYSLDLEKACSL